MGGGEIYQCRSTLWMLPAEKAYFQRKGASVTLDGRSQIAASMFHGSNVMSGNRNFIMIRPICRLENAERFVQDRLGSILLPAAFQEGCPGSSVRCDMGMVRTLQSGTDEYTATCPMLADRVVSGRMSEAA